MTSQNYSANLGLASSPTLSNDPDLSQLFNAVHILAQQIDSLTSPAKVYTSATLPSAALLPVNTLIQLSDVANTFWYTNGSNWKLVNNIATLKSVGTAASVTGTLVKTALGSYTLPAGILSINSGIRITGYLTYTNSINNKILEIDLGGTTVYTKTATITDTQHFTVIIRNRGSVSSQVIQTSASLSGISAVVTSAENTAVSKTITINGTLTDVTETITLEGYTIELLQA